MLWICPFVSVDYLGEPGYTRTDSTAAYPGFPETTIMLPEQVRDVLNASLRWKQGLGT